MPTHDPADLAQCSVNQLIIGGDWASAESYDETLAAIARHLAARVRPEERLELEQVADLCAVDMTAATALWNVATAAARGRCGQPGPRHGDPEEIQQTTR